MIEGDIRMNFFTDNNGVFRVFSSKHLEIKHRGKKESHLAPSYIY
jgi:hypothetical protein